MNAISVKKKRALGLPDVEFNRHVGDVFWTARTESGMTPEQAGARVGRTAAEVEAFERGEADEVFVMLALMGCALKREVRLELVD